MPIQEDACDNAPDSVNRYAVRNTKRYKIGEIADLLGVTPEAIRYYEKNGIIEPERNPISNYRYYSAWDLNMLLRARTYHQQGFSMQEITKIMKDFDPSATLSMLSDRTSNLYESITSQITLMNELKDSQKVIDDAVSEYHRFKLQYRPSMHFLHTQQGYDIVSSSSALYRSWVDHAAYVLPGGIFQGKGPRDVVYGLFVDDDKLAAVDYRNEDEIVAIPSCQCLSTAFISGSDTELCYESFQFALDYISDHDLEISGDPISRIALMSREGECYRSLHKLWIPIKGDVNMHVTKRYEADDFFGMAGFETEGLDLARRMR